MRPRSSSGSIPIPRGCGHRPRRRRPRRDTGRAAAAAVAAHCAAVIDAAGPACVAVKPQLACFERLGAPGWRALRRVVEHVGRSGCSCSPTPSAATSTSPPPPTPRRWPARRQRRSAVRGPRRTRRPRARTWASTRCARCARPGPGSSSSCARRTPARSMSRTSPRGRRAVWERVARIVDGLGEPGPDSGLHDVGAVVGATAPSTSRACASSCRARRSCCPASARREAA